MNMVVLETGGLSTLAAEQDADVIVLRGEAMAAYVAAVSAAFGQPFDLKGAGAIHGVKHGGPNHPAHVDTTRSWYLGEPMPETDAELRQELQDARARIWFLENKVRRMRAAVEIADEPQPKRQASV